MLALDESYWWASRVLEVSTKIWRDRVIQWAMMRWDANKLRQVEMAVEVPPPECAGTLGPYEEEGDQMWRCEVVDGRGRTCVKEFASKAGLQARGEHGATTVPDLAAINQCCFCRSMFRSRGAARQHMANSYQRGRCIVGKAHRPVEPMKIDSVQCKVRQAEFPGDELEEYYEHLKEHIIIPVAKLTGRSKPSEGRSGLSKKHHRQHRHQHQHQHRHSYPPQQHRHHRRRHRPASSAAQHSSSGKHRRSMGHHLRRHKPQQHHHRRRPLAASYTF